MRRQRRPLAVALLVVLGAGLLGACSGDDGPGVGDARLETYGDVQTAEPDGPWRDADGGIVERGERVRVLTGAAVLTTHDDARLELREGSEVQVDVAPRLARGEVLTQAPDAPLTVAVTEGTATLGQGAAARFRRATSFEAGVYRGAVTVASAGRSARVPAFRRTVVPAPGLVSTPSPLVYRDADEWDRRFLGRWIDLGRDLEARSVGLTRQLRVGETRPASFFRQLLPNLGDEPAFERLVVDSPRPVGETLVGSAIAAESRRGGFAQRWARVFAFRDDGAPWGLVAADQAVGRAPLIGPLESALGDFARQAIADAVSAPSTPSGTAATGTAPGTPPGSTTPTTAPPTTPPTTPPPTVPPTTVPTAPGTGVEPVDGAVDAVEDALDELVSTPPRPVALP